MGPLVENLESLGYTDGVNIMTAPYDWRLPYYYLEVRASWLGKDVTVSTFKWIHPLSHRSVMVTSHG